MSLNFDEKFNKADIIKLLTAYKSAYSASDDKQTWFERLKTCASECGFVDMKTYKANPEAYIGNIADASNIVRISVTGRTTTPDLYEIIKLLGTNELERRLDYVINNLK